jgi:hypothetical protein
VHRFTDPTYADLTLLMRTGQRPGEVFDALQQRGLIQIHRSDIERVAALTGAALTDVDGTLIADTREQVASLNAAIRDQRLVTGETSAAGAVTTVAGERLGVGDRIATRRNDRDHNTAHLVAETLEQARAQWIEVFSRDRADLGPGHAAQTAAEDVDRYGPQAPPRTTARDVRAPLHSPHHGPRRPPEPLPAVLDSARSRGISR